MEEIKLTTEQSQLAPEGFTFKIKEGWMLNQNEKVVNGILRGLKRCNGECPCHNLSNEKMCPCSGYREEDHCCCTLYVKK